VPKAGRSFTDDMNRGAIRHDRELFGEANETDDSSVNFEPRRSAGGSPALLRQNARSRGSQNSMSF